MAFKAYRKNPNTPILEHHPLKNKSSSQHRNNSVAVTLTGSYRAIYVDFPNGHRSGKRDLRLWYWIGTHEAYNTFTGSKKH
ncbi:hypothetical protein Pan216_17800 [Planctomycetes bacterium Pan216]|uniref:mRNA interferase HigB n=1 Tax=Kolteria novifilia TaxID=2527975 RepID=A0A518B1R5_9BACT|nr:hypothetical protein Pan216_17800 [Planctomycetes bacterium Pan216]